MAWIIGLNSLRLFAIILILIYHFWRHLLPGGFIGVEVFFAISGFLLFSNLLRNWYYRGRISYRHFLKDRLAKLWPPLLLMIVLVVLLSFAVDSSVLPNLGARSLAASLFATNIYELIIGGSYEDTFAPNIFEHTWFIALLMQLCLVLPLLAVSYLGNAQADHRLRRRRLKRFSFGVLALGFVSFGLMFLYAVVFGQPNRAYFGLDTHMGAFCFGAALAGFNLLYPRTPRTRKVLPAFILSASLLTILLFSRKLSFDNPLSFSIALPYAAILTPIAIYCLIKLQHDRIGLSAERAYHFWPKLLSLMELMGGLSFGVYLYHYPLYHLLAHILPNSAPVWLIPLLAIFSSLLLTWVSAKLLRLLSVAFTKRRHPQIYILSAALVGVVCVVAFRLITIPRQSVISTEIGDCGELERLEPLSISGAQQQAFASLDSDLQSVIALAGNSKIERPPVKNNYRQPNGAKILLIGDSVMLGAKDAIETKIPTAYVDARENRGIETAEKIITSYQASGQLPEVIVIGLATNERSITEQTFERIMAAAGAGHRFVLITGYAGPLQNRDSQNAVIREFAARHENVYLADWQAIAKDNWSLMYPDHIHLNLDGRVVFARLLDSTLRQLPNYMELIK